MSGGYLLNEFRIIFICEDYCYCFWELVVIFVVSVVIFYFMDVFGLMMFE